MQNKELMVDGKFNQFIYYPHKKIFVIVPLLSDRDIKELENYIIELREVYCTNEICTFLWMYDHNRNSIVIDDTTKSVECDIFYQFTKIALWLFAKDYDVKGSFWYRTKKIIEYICCDGVDKSIIHYIIDDIIDETTSNTVEIIANAEEKIKKFEKTRCHDTANYNKIKTLQDVHKRLNLVESKLHIINNDIESRWNTFAIVGLFAVGTMIAFTMLSADNTPN